MEADMSRKRNWSRNQRQWGPFTYAKDSSKPFGFSLHSWNEDEDEAEGLCLRLQALGHTLIIELPSIIKPGREYGLSIHEGYLHVYYGAQTMSNDTSKSFCKSLPWMAWRFVRKSLYDAAGEHFWTQLESKKDLSIEPLKRFEAQRAAKEECPSIFFVFDDYDGERIEATTRIEEMEWHLGEGWFKWLSFFAKPRIRRSLDIEFSKEVGPKKGSWKGGTLGHGIEMLPGEKHVAAFKRYCEAHQMKFVIACWTSEEAHKLATGEGP
jgi:hypothetical protein